MIQYLVYTFANRCGNVWTSRSSGYLSQGQANIFRNFEPWREVLWVKGPSPNRHFWFCGGSVMVLSDPSKYEPKVPPENHLRSSCVCNTGLLSSGVQRDPKHGFKVKCTCIGQWHPILAEWIGWTIC